MKHPEKWRETADPFQLPFRRFILKEVLGYPHAGNDVFQVTGIYGEMERFPISQKHLHDIHFSLSNPAWHYHTKNE